MQLNKNVVYDEFKFYWEDNIWLEYISRKDIACVVANLLEGMDDASHEYVQMHLHLLRLLPYKKHILIDKNYGWTGKDAEDATLAQRIATSQQLKEQEAFIYVNKYGMRDLPKEVLASIDGTCIVDGGAYTGDTLFLFHSLFPQAKIFAFEPQKSAFDKLKKSIITHNMAGKAVPICRGLSNTEEDLTLYTGYEIDSGATCNALAKYDKIPTDTIKTTTIDATLKSSPVPVGLIKLDIEGLEQKALEGSVAVITRYKPVIIAAIYHRPEDFFELKDYIKKLNPEYKFMIRRSEKVIPMADLVLIAY